MGGAGPQAEAQGECARLRPTARGSRRKLDVEAAEADLVRTSDALRATIEFLRDVAHIPHAALQPYELPVVVLARFFSIHKKPSERTLILMKRWLWRGSLGERLGGASGSMQQHVDGVCDKEDGSVQALLNLTGLRDGIHLEDWDHTAGATVRSARGKMLVCALLARLPRDLLTGDRFGVSELFRHGITDVLRPIVQGSASGPHRGKGIVNKLLHPKAPIGPRQLIVDCTDEASLLSHGINAAARDALRQGNVETFYSLRADDLRRTTQAFFERHAELSRDDTPSLTALARRSA